LHPPHPDLGVGDKSVGLLLRVAKRLLRVPKVVGSAAVVLGSHRLYVMRTERSVTLRLSSHAKGGVAVLKVALLEELNSLGRKLELGLAFRGLEHVLVL